MNDLVARARLFATEAHERTDQRRKYTDQTYQGYLRSVAAMAAEVTDDLGVGRRSLVTRHVGKDLRRLIGLKVVRDGSYSLYFSGGRPWMDPDNCQASPVPQRAPVLGQPRASPPRSALIETACIGAPSPRQGTVTPWARSGNVERCDLVGHRWRLLPRSPSGLSIPPAFGHFSPGRH
jgi:hypothetical protein